MCCVLRFEYLMKFYKIFVFWKCFFCGKVDIMRSLDLFFNLWSVDIDESCVVLKFD